VRVLERRAVVGGAAVTEEFHPGFRNSVASYTVSLLNPKVIRDLRLASTACAWSSGRTRTSCRLPDGRSFRLGGEHTDAGEVAKFSAARCRAPAGRYYAMLDRVVAVLRELHAPHAAQRRRTLRLADWLRARDAVGEAA
jgi:phytoene dehydrogenase-like protein